MFGTLWFKGSMLMPTMRFRQKKDGRVYHNCGAEESCRLFPRFIVEKGK
jgi:hypothetical protein